MSLLLLVLFTLFLLMYCLFCSPHFILKSQHLMGSGIVSLNSNDEGISKVGEEGKGRGRGKEEEKGMETPEKVSEGSDAWDGIHA